jgi:hypothetical protein
MICIENHYVLTNNISGLFLWKFLRIISLKSVGWGRKELLFLYHRLLLFLCPLSFSQDQEREYTVKSLLFVGYQFSWFSLLG